MGNYVLLTGFRPDQQETTFSMTIHNVFNCTVSILSSVPLTIDWSFYLYVVYFNYYIPKVLVPKMADKPEWKLNGQMLTMTFPLEETIATIKVKEQTS